MAIWPVPLRMESMQPKARSTASTSTNEPIRVRASWGREENTPVVSSRLMEVTMRSQLRPGW